MSRKLEICKIYDVITVLLGDPDVNQTNFFETFIKSVENV